MVNRRLVGLTRVSLPHLLLEVPQGPEFARVKGHKVVMRGAVGETVLERNDGMPALRGRGASPPCNDHGLNGANGGGRSATEAALGSCDCCFEINDASFARPSAVHSRKEEIPIRIVRPIRWPEP